MVLNKSCLPLQHQTSQEQNQLQVTLSPHGSNWGQGRQPTNIPAAAAKQPQAARAEHRAGREVEEAAVPNSFTDLIHDDTAEGIEPLPWEGRFQQAPPAGAQRAADDVRLQDDVCLHFLGVPPNLQAQQDTLVKIQP